MDLLLNRDDSQLQAFKEAPLLFTPLCNSTCSAGGLLTNVRFEEKDLMEHLACTGNIVAIDSNFGHLKAASAEPVAPVSTVVRRGRKKKPKQRKQRKKQGDGSSFNSEITFTILGKHVRKIPDPVDKNSAKAFKLPDGLHEVVNKEYKIKVFRNGSITIPGILTEDMSDIMGPLNELCAYLGGLLLEDVKPIDIISVMRNYKTHLIDNQINIREIQRHCETHFHSLLNIRFSDVIDFLVNPEFNGAAFSPNLQGWNNVIFEVDLSGSSIDFIAMKQCLRDSISTKNLFIKFETLEEFIQGCSIMEIYKKIQYFGKALDAHLTALSNDIYKRIIRYLVVPIINSIENNLTKSKDNRLSHIKYDPEKYPGFIIKVKTPNDKVKSKLTTIKIFQSGKINIDGANSRDEAEYIYYWLNNLFYNNINFIVNDDFDFNATDSEFSEEEDGEEMA